MFYYQRIVMFYVHNGVNLEGWEMYAPPHVLTSGIAYLLSLHVFDQNL